MRAAVPDTGADSTPLLDRRAPLPEPAPRRSSLRLVLSASVGLAIALGYAALMARDPALRDSTRAGILGHFDHLFPGGLNAARYVYAGVSLVAVVPLAIAVRACAPLVATGSVVGRCCSCSPVRPRACSPRAS